MDFESLDVSCNARSVCHPLQIANVNAKRFIRGFIWSLIQKLSLNMSMCPFIEYMFSFNDDRLMVHSPVQFSSASLVPARSNFAS